MYAGSAPSSKDPAGRRAVIYKRSGRARLDEKSGMPVDYIGRVGLTSEDALQLGRLFDTEVLSVPRQVGYDDGIVSGVRSRSRVLIRHTPNAVDLSESEVSSAPNAKDGCPGWLASVSTFIADNDKADLRNNGMGRNPNHRNRDRRGATKHYVQKAIIRNRGA